jgi:hypothetical protein
VAPPGFWKLRELDLLVGTFHWRPLAAVGKVEEEPFGGFERLHEPLAETLASQVIASWQQIRAFEIITNEIGALVRRCGPA